MPNIKAKTWHRFMASNFCVSADVMGSQHKFEFENYNVSVRLPGIEAADRDNKYDQVASLSSSLSKTGEPLTFTVHKVDMEIEIPKSLSAPKKALNKPPSQYDAFNDKQRESVDLICKGYPLIAERAYDYWLDIIRWSSSCSLIGQLQLSDKRSGWGIYIVDDSTDHRVWGCTQVIVVKREYEVSTEHWNTAQAHLSNNAELPMHIRFLHDADTSIENQLYEKAILELALSCEIYLRYSVFKTIPDTLSAELHAYIEEANINQYVGRFFKSLVDTSAESDYKRLTKELSSLISRRNSYVHMGVMDDANQDRCIRYSTAVKKLFSVTLKNEN
jgi:uncharacterized protein (UPF0332 family)